MIKILKKLFSSKHNKYEELINNLILEIRSKEAELLVDIDSIELNNINNQDIIFEISPHNWSIQIYETTRKRDKSKNVHNIKLKFENTLFKIMDALDPSIEKSKEIQSNIFKAFKQEIAMIIRKSNIYKGKSNLFISIHDDTQEDKI